MEVTLARLLHTADWHLGRILHGVHLTEDQEYLLDQVVKIVEDHRPDAVIVAGDVYDRAVPPPEAVRLLDDTLTRIVELGVPVIMIAGNHDGADRLQFGSRLMARAGLTIASVPQIEVVKVRMNDEYGPLDVYALPFFDPVEVRDLFGDQDIHGHDAATARMVEEILAHAEEGVRRVLVGHMFVFGGKASDSERPLSVGGAEMVDATHLAGFDYVALGHLHRAQAVGTDQIRYAGSLSKYSFQEANHRKSVSMVTIGEPGGNPVVEEIPLVLRRDLRQLEGTLDEIIKGVGTDGCDDYVAVMLTDPGLIYDAMGRLRQVYPNVLAIDRVRTAFDGEIRSSVDMRKMADRDLFAQFFKDFEGREMTDEEAQALDDTLESIARTDREARQ